MKAKFESKNIDNIVSVFDYSNIQDYEVSDRDVELLALKAKQYGFKTVVVCPSSLPIADRILKWSGISIAVAVSYPSGAYFASSKKEEIEGILELDYRVDELYMVMAVGRFLSGYEDETREEIEMFAKAAKGRVAKLVIEASPMTMLQKQRICDMAVEAGLDYIVASTGFVPYDVPMPTANDIKELVIAAAGRIGIIACGEITTRKQVLEMLEAGAERVCTLNADRIVEEFKNVKDNYD